MPRTREARALPDGWGRAGVELGGTSGYRVGRGRGCRLGVVERHTVEPVLPWRGPLNGTAFRLVPRSVGLPRWLRQWVWPRLGSGAIWGPQVFGMVWRVAGTVLLSRGRVPGGLSGAPAGAWVCACEQG